MSEIDGVVKEFLVESYENLDQLDRDLVALEKDPKDRDRLNNVFRTIHTIKGTCGFFGFSKLESVTHVGENLLSRLRDGSLLLDPERTSALLALLDAVREMLSEIEKNGNDGDGDYRELIERLTRLQEPDATQAQTQDEPDDTPPGSDDPPQTIGDVLVRTGKVKPEEVLDAVHQQMEGDPLRVGEILVEKGLVQMQDIREAVKTLQESKGTTVVDTNIRVDVSLLDKLMNLVGELVLTRNQILQFNSTQKDPAFLSTTQRLNLITSELQEGVMKTRMQPIGNLWNRYPRVVRDLAMTCGKEVRLEMEGSETELDKTIIEAIKDPLTHIVRNAVDHGIESPEVRVASGKSRQGTLTLRAFHEGGQVNIEIMDDGAGVNTERVKAKAVERGLISRDQALRMTEREAMNLLFMPGFSTAEKITNVSGRGVGMDVVKTNVEKIGGTIDIQSQQGKGTTIKIKIPLTLAIIPALIVSANGERYAIPQVNLLELVRLEGDSAKRGIELIHGAPVYRLRGQLLPLVYLSQELGQSGEANRQRSEREARDSIDSDTINIVVLQADDRQFGLVVDAINDTEEIVVKPLGTLLKGITVFAGSTIMGDGRVALILDVLGIAQKAGVVSEVRDRTRANFSSSTSDRNHQQQSLLLLGIGENRQAAIPLSLVARLEEIPTASVEQTGDQEVVQYRGSILPLIRLSHILGVSPSTNSSDVMQVIVYSEGTRSVGIVVDRILDIVETSFDPQTIVSAPGIIATAVIQQRVTDLLDIQTIIRSVRLPHFESVAV